MKKFFKLLLIIPLVIFFFSAWLPFSKYHWHESKDGKVLIWTNSDKDFIWNGEVRGKFAHGRGTVYYYDGENRTNSETLDLIYGADRNQYEEIKGWFYVGEYKRTGWDSKPHGIGVKKGEKSVYAGKFTDGMLSGYGWHFSYGNLQYEGSFFNDKYSGQGRLYRNGNLIYEGNFEGNFQNGIGTEYNDGAEFKGSFRNGNKHGAFTISKNGTDRFVNFQNGVPNLNDCKIKFADGTIWEGPLNKNYERDGEGKTITADGFARKEIRSKGNIDTEQTLPFPDGSEYKGEFKNNKKNGYGEISFKDGSKYSGMWLNDVVNGYGEYITDNYAYYGEWEKGLFNGEGEFVFSAGTYSGEWKSGKINGLGKLETPENRI